MPSYETIAPKRSLPYSTKGANGFQFCCSMLIRARIVSASGCIYCIERDAPRKHVWKFIQRLALGYPTVFLISIYTFIVAYVYLPPGPNDVRRKWIINESMGLTRMRSNFIFDNQNCLVGATKTSGRGSERNVFNNFDLSENEIDTAELENSDTRTSQRCIMTFSSFLSRDSFRNGRSCVSIIF